MLSLYISEARFSSMNKCENALPGAPQLNIFNYNKYLQARSKQCSDTLESFWCSFLDTSDTSKSNRHYQESPNQRLEANRNVRRKMARRCRQHVSRRLPEERQLPKDQVRAGAHGGSTHGAAGQAAAGPSLPLGTALPHTGGSDTVPPPTPRSPSPSRRRACPPYGPGTPSRRRRG